MKNVAKRTWMRVLSVMLTLGLTASVVSVSTVDAKKAKKPKLSKSKVTVKVGKTAKVTVKNAKPKKVTWSVNKKGKKIVKLTKKTKKYVKVKGLKKGTAKVTAKIKVGKKVYKKKLTVKVKKKNSTKSTPVSTNGTVATASTKPVATASAPAGNQPSPTNPGGAKDTEKPADTVAPTTTNTETPDATPTPTQAGTETEQPSPTAPVNTADISTQKPSVETEIPGEETETPGAETKAPVDATETPEIVNTGTPEPTETPAIIETPEPTPGAASGSATVVMSVVSGSSAAVSGSSVVVSGSAISGSVQIGDQVQLRSSITTSGCAVEGEPVWSTLNEKVATVTGTGESAVVNAVGIGRTKIKATYTTDTGIVTSGSYEVEVLPLEEYYLDLSTFVTAGIVEDGYKVNQDGSATLTFKQNYAGTKIMIPEIAKKSGLTAVEISVVSRQNGAELDGGNQIVPQDSAGGDIGVYYKKGVFSFVVPDDKELSHIIFNAQEVKDKVDPLVPQEMTISYVKLMRVNTLDLKDFKAGKGDTIENNADGSLTITRAGTYSGSGIDVPDAYAECQNVEIKVVNVFEDGAEVEENAQIDQLQFVVMDTEGKELMTRYLRWTADKEGVSAINLSAELAGGKKIGKIILNSQDVTKAGKQRISYIKLY